MMINAHPTENDSSQPAMRVKRYIITYNMYNYIIHDICCIYKYNI